MAGPGQHFSMPARGSLPASQMMTSQQQSMGGYMPPSSQMGPMQGPGMPGQGPGQGQGPGIQHQQSFPGPGPGPSTMPHTQPQMTSPTKMVNAVTVCKRGQETNQDLMNKVLEIFRLFKQLQLPNGANNQMFQERRGKIEEGMKQLNQWFKMLRVMHDKVNELVPDPEDPAEEVLIAVKGDENEKKNTNTDAYRHVSEDHQQLVEQIRQRNQQIKEIIDKIRTVMWEINTMIVMRKT